MTRPGQIVDFEIAVADHVTVLRRDHADGLAGLDFLHPAVDGLIVIDVDQQVVVILAGKRTDEALEEFFILGLHRSKVHNHVGVLLCKRISLCALRAELGALPALPKAASDITLCLPSALR